ncbi:MAG: pyridoxal-dependent decarboxylase [Candidatus Neomarinimicrobiota bacterium]|nr:pyridoxal-dependent decarboxylase [Candidatus Neomarinimicrobiota bacterium]
MKPEQFRKAGKDVIDWIADYYEQIGEFPVMSQVEAGEVRSKLPTHPPLDGEPFDAMMKDVEEIVLPGISHWQSPNFYGFFPANASGPAILGDLLSSGFGVNGMLWAASPACTEVETHMMDWLVEMLDLPVHFLSTSDGGGVIHDTASSATLCALLAGRERATAGLGNRDGVKTGLTAYTSNQSHSSVEKAVKIAGLGSNNLRLIEVDKTFAMKADALAAAIMDDVENGKTPTFVCATSGTTSTTAFDPLGEIGKICGKHNIWLHVDAAMAGTAALCPEFRWVHDGLEHADSYCFNPHKWMLTNFDCDAFFVKDRKALLDTLSIFPEYLKNKASQSDAVIDYRDWQIPLGRRFRALKLWFVIRHYGVEGLQTHVRKSVELGQLFHSFIENDNRFEPMAPAPLNLACFRMKGSDEKNKSLLNRLNRSGHMYLTHTRLNGKYTIRFCIGNQLTEQHHVEASWKKIVETSKEIT